MVWGWLRPGLPLLPLDESAPPTGRLRPLALLPPWLPAGAGTLCVTLLPAFQSHEWHQFRAGLFASLGLFGLVPVIHGWVANLGVTAVAHAMSLELLMGAVYLVRLLRWCGAVLAAGSVVACSLRTAAWEWGHAQMVGRGRAASPTSSCSIITTACLPADRRRVVRHALPGALQARGL